MMKRLIFVALLSLLLAFAVPFGGAEAASKAGWTSNNYSLTQTEKGFELNGSATYGNRCSTAEKIEMDGFELKLTLGFDFETKSFDWLAVIFASSKTPYLTSGAATSLLLRPRGTDLVCSIMNSNLTEVASVKTAFVKGEAIDVKVALDENSVTFTINGEKLTSNNSSINYSMLRRGAYCSLSANAGADNQEEAFSLAVEEVSVNVHDSSADVIIYGSTITVEDERIKKLTSENFSVKQPEPAPAPSGGGCKGNAESSPLCLIALISVTAALLSLNKTKKREEK